MGWFVRRLGVADVVTLANGAIGFAAGVLAFHDVQLAAQLVLLAAILDAIDGILARKVGNTEAGPLLDSIVDVVSFGVSPALVAVAVAQAEYGGPGTSPTWMAAAFVGVGATFALLSVVRTAMYETYVDPADDRPGVQNTLAATILAAAYLADFLPTWAFLAFTVVLALSMIAPVPYPKLRAGDAIVLGVVQVAAVVAPTAFEAIFPRLILVAALAYAIGAPWFYWGKNGGPTVSRVD